MNQLKGIQKLNQLLRIQSITPVVSPILRDSIRHFSSTPPPNDSFVPPSDTGLMYGKLTSISPNTLKGDIINMFEGCNLTVDDIKVDYDRTFYPVAMYVQFSSRSRFNSAFRELTRKNRFFRLEKVDRQQWDLVTPYNGRYVLFQGIPRNALIDDVERLLSGCNYDSSSVELFTRSIQFEPVRLAKVRFPSHIEAMNAVIRKNGAFCLNNRIMARLIQ